LPEGEDETHLPTPVDTHGVAGIDHECLADVGGKDILIHGSGMINLKTDSGVAVQGAKFCSTDDEFSERGA
jgi:hypothetical protein